ncbi:MAG: LacI family DNA-binding transcriptional regulator [Victivallales bacterium]|nr:LacI family DNA-binding transcriptional regulator [Victivallales bacterium]
MISSLELANLCGVSQGTVDRAVHGRKGISEKTRAMILRTADELGYLPNPAAREIITGRTKNVAALIPGLQTPFFMDMMAEVKDAIAHDGYRLLISTVNDTDEMIALLSEFGARRFAGAVVVPPCPGIAIPPSILGRMKVLSLLEPCLGDQVSFISPDETATGEKATRHLVERGHRKIAHVMPQRHSQAIEKRKKGYENIMRKHGMRTSVLTFPQDEGAVSDLVKKNGMTAFFCHNDWLALSLIRIIGTLGLKVPGDISVMGVDNSPTFKAFYPGITSVEYPLGWLAAEVANALKGKRMSTPFKNMQIAEAGSVKSLPHPK